MIYISIGDPIICGGLIVPCQLAGELKKRGFDVAVIADRSNQELERYIGEPFKDKSVLDSTTEVDTIIAVRWEECEWLEKYPGRKIQLVQAQDSDFDCGEDWKIKMREARNNQKWELVGVSQFCLNEWKRGVIIPNGIHSRFLDYFEKVC